MRLNDSFKISASPFFKMSLCVVELKLQMLIFSFGFFWSLLLLLIFYVLNLLKRHFKSYTGALHLTKVV